MRLYNGAPDDELQAVWESRDDARAALKEADPDAWCTYFPLEGMYSCSRWIGEPGNRTFQELTVFHSTVEASCAAAIKQIKENDK